MRKTSYVILLFLNFAFLTFPQIGFTQIENVPLSNSVYDFLKEMSVKGVIHGFDDDNINLSRFQVISFLETAEQQSSLLNNTERKLLRKYSVEFETENMNGENATVLFDGKENFREKIKEAFSDKQKYLYAYRDGNSNLFIEGIGNIYLSNEVKPDYKKNAIIMDGGIRAKGTLFGRLGYNFMINKGLVLGSKSLAALTEPRLNTDYKFLEDKERILNYDFAEAYLKYYFEPSKKLNISIQFGREKIRYGAGYGSKLILSGNTPNMDFLKTSLSYGIISFSSIHASTVGQFSFNKDETFTKHFSANRLKVSLPGLFDFGICESVIYSRPFDFAYLNPILFYTFTEKALQDRDNKNFSIDLQTKFIKNVELQGTLFIDDDELFSTFGGKSDYDSKNAYQVGAFIYEPFSLDNLSLILEYTKIRPYVYTHYNYKNSYTSYGLNLGHSIGPNADEIYSRISYDIKDWGKVNLEYQKIRAGENLLDEDGNIIKNVGGDIFTPYRFDIDSKEAKFLDGERINTHNVTLNFRFEPLTNFIFDLFYIYNKENNISENSSINRNFAYMKLSIDY